MLLAFAAALVIQFAPVPTPAGAPAPSFALHGFTADGPTDAPVLSRDRDGDAQLSFSFVAPLDGACMIAQLVQAQGRTMAFSIARGSVTLNGAVRETVPLPSKQQIADAGATADGVTIVVVCAVPDDPSRTLTSSTVYHAEALPTPA